MYCNFNLSFYYWTAFFINADRFLSRLNKAFIIIIIIINYYYYYYY